VAERSTARSTMVVSTTLERRAERPSDLAKIAKGLMLFHRAGKLARPRLHLLKEPPFSMAITALVLLDRSGVLGII
jgi:hypothetical protein